MRTNSSGRAGQFFGRPLIRAAAVGLSLLARDVVAGPGCVGIGAIPPEFILPALRQPQARPGFGPAIAFTVHNAFTWLGRVRQPARSFTRRTGATASTSA